MDIKILQEHPNPLLGRKEYLVEISHAPGPTPKRDEVRKEISELLKVPKDRLVVEWMHARYGVTRTRGLLHVYDTKEKLGRVARTHIQVRNGLKAKETKAAPGAAAPAAPAAPAADAKKA